MAPRRRVGPIPRTLFAVIPTIAGLLTGVGMVASSKASTSVESVPSPQAAPRAAAVLAAVRGTPAVSCELMLQALANRSGTPTVRPRVNVPGALEVPDRELVEWAGMGRLGPENTAPLLEAFGSDDA